MAQAAKANTRQLISPMAQLDKALAISAERAQRMAKAFGLKVPGVAPAAPKKLVKKKI